MIRRSAAIAAVAILLSALLHGLGVTVSWREPPAPIVPDVSTEVVALDNAFEDLAESAAEPVTPEPAPVPEPEQAETPPEPDVVDPPTSDAQVASDNPQRVFAPDSGVAPVPQRDTTGGPDPGDGPPPAPPPVTPPVAAPVTPPTESPPVAQEPVTEPGPGPAEQLAALPEPEQPSLPVAPQPAAAAVPVLPLETAPIDPTLPEAPTDETGDSTLAVAESPRPRLPTRPKPQSADASPVDLRTTHLAPSELIESPLTAYQRDRTDLTLRPGSGGASGGVGFQDSRGPGNSDTTNYAGRVLMHLNRAPQVRVSARGAARVFFIINPDGSLATVDVIDSTGSADVNRAAKAQVRGAAPFPRPPQGSRRQLTFIYRIN